MSLSAKKNWWILKGMVAVIHETLKWLRPIASMHGGDSRLFVSGARGATAFVPKDFADLLGPYRAVVAKHRGVMLAELADTGWPASTRPATEILHLHRCKRCDGQHAKLWLHRQLCFTCEETSRQEGRCPYGKNCGTRTFCPHGRCCVVCEGWSCEACHLLRGDSEDVWHLVGQLRPVVIFMDFDRTLATTKSGTSPLQGSHSVDPELAAVCSSHDHVQIVTRSSQKEDIETFLAQKAVHVAKVRSLRREGKQKKSEVILEVLSQVDSSNGGSAGVGLFIDDDIKELTDPGMQGLVDAGRLERFLLVRGGSKEVGV